MEPITEKAEEPITGYKLEQIQLYKRVLLEYKLQYTGGELDGMIIILQRTTFNPKLPLVTFTWFH